MIENIIVDELIKRNMTVSFAESCTGGLLSAKLVNVPNASKVLDRSFITYSEQAKSEMLGVNEETIYKYGVVSEQVASEMAYGAAKNSNAQIAVSVTGVAGPSGGTENTPVGTVCFGFYINGNILTYTEYFGDAGRQSVREKCVDFCFEILKKYFENLKN